MDFEVDLKFWAELMSFKPPRAVRGVFVEGPNIPTRTQKWMQRIQDGVGVHVNLDFYPVRISVLPTVDGRQLQAPALLEYVRKNLNSFVDAKRATFSPSTSNEYGGKKNVDKWNSARPIGSVVRIEMGDPQGMKGLRSGVDSGSVLVSDIALDHWVFSTVHSAEDGTHPVSGNRQFGFFSLEDGSLVVYARGADRVSDDKLLFGNYEGLVFDSQDQLWRSFQQRVVDFVNAHGGKAKMVPAFVEHPKWENVKQFFSPTEEPPGRPNVSNSPRFRIPAVRQPRQLSQRSRPTYSPGRTPMPLHAGVFGRIARFFGASTVSSPHTRYQIERNLENLRFERQRNLQGLQRQEFERQRNFQHLQQWQERMQRQESERVRHQVDALQRHTNERLHHQLILQSRRLASEHLHQLSGGNLGVPLPIRSRPFEQFGIRHIQSNSNALNALRVGPRLGIPLIPPPLPRFTDAMLWRKIEDRRFWENKRREIMEKPVSFIRKSL